MKNKYLLIFLFLHLLRNRDTKLTKKVKRKLQLEKLNGERISLKIKNLFI